MSMLADELLVTYSKPVFNFCYHLAGNQTDAEDLYQDTFLVAWEKREYIQKTISSGSTQTIEPDIQIRNYLFGIAANLWRNMQRKKFRRNRITPLDECEDGVMKAVSEENVPEKALYRRN